MKRGRRLRHDQEGGDYLEAILAIMVISCGLCLAVSSLPGLLRPQDDPGPLKESGQEMLGRSLAELEEGTGVVSSHALRHLDGMGPPNAPAIGCRVDVRLLHSADGCEESHRLHLSGQLPERMGDVLVLTEPISLQREGGEVCAALLVVMVW